jgi:branched-chain amino acid transport system ATP-binding protein
MRAERAAGPALAVEDLAVRFGGVTALDGVALAVKPGEIRAIIGPNGAGKTTLFNAITGAIRPARGRVRLHGRDITGAPPYAVARLGLARTFQITNIFPDLTVAAQAWLGINARGRCPWHPFARPDRDGPALARVRALLADLGLADRLEEPAANLSHADQRVIEIALALSLDPDVLLLDEPTQGVGPHETERLVALIAGLAPTKTVLIIEHNVEAVLRLATTVTVLDRGRVLSEGTPTEIMADRRVRDVYLGTTLV